MDIIVVPLYFFFLAIWVLYSISLIHLIVHVEIEKYRKKRNKGKEVIYPPLDLNTTDLPVVTVQLPLYNELYVAERVIDCVCNFNYPASKLEIQVLDDSTDETVDIVAARVAHWQQEGIDIKQIHRTNRSGYKAGALAEATPKAKGEFIALFDADFLPDENFLLKTLPYFDNEKVGVVQARWGHLNGEYSLLTKLQTMSIDAFFLVEQYGRTLANYWIRFNGSGGLWRKSCVEDAGGWTGDTLSEDLDLAFRAQMKGWVFRYTNSIECKGEVPVTIHGVKNQYYRWSKGKTEVFKKLSGAIISTKLPFMKKLHVFADLWNIWANMAILMISVLSVPVVYFAAQSNTFDEAWKYSSIGLIYTATLIYMMLSVYDFRHSSLIKSIRELLFDFPAFAFLFAGLTLHQNYAIFDAFRGKKTPFIRTPKYDIKTNEGKWTGKKYLPTNIPFVTYMEAFLAVFFAAGVYLDIAYHWYGFIPWHIFLSFGAGYTFYLTVKQDKIKTNKKVAPTPQLVKA
ncbi:MAG: glycosyltransferase [Cyclobacteriaceae bacterium]